jgi:hypothetical protein
MAQKLLGYIEVLQVLLSPPPLSVYRKKFECELPCASLTAFVFPKASYISHTCIDSFLPQNGFLYWNLLLFT